MQHKPKTDFSNLKSILVVFLLAFLFASCSVQKRHYMKGMYFENLFSKKHEKKEGYTIKSFYKNDAGLKNDVLASAKPIEHAAEIELKNPEAAKPVIVFENCDTIFFRDGTVVATKIIELNSNEIKYRYCSGTETEVVRVALKSGVDKIIYANGLKEIFAKPTPTNANYYPDNKYKKTNGLSVGGFILSIISIPVCFIAVIFFLFTGIFGQADTSFLLLTGVTLVPGLILSILGLVQINKEKDKYKGLALSLAGIVLCSILLFLMLLLLSGL